MTLSDILTDRDLGKFYKLAQSFCATVRASAKRYNKWVTGNSSSLLNCNVEVVGNSLQAVCSFQGKYAQFWQLQTGRKEGKMPPVSALYKWSKQRGISFTSDKERWGFAWALAKTIADSGTLQYRQKNKLDGIFNKNWIAFQKNFDRYVQMWCEKILSDEVARIDNNFKNN